MLYWIELAIGAWLIVSPWILDFSGIVFAKWSSVLIGLFFVVVNLHRLFGTVATNPTENQK